jgi:hypothetical protein
MIQIKILNVDDITKKRKGWIFSKIAPKIMDVEGKIEEAIAEQIQISLAEEGVLIKIDIIDPK